MRNCSIPTYSPRITATWQMLARPVGHGVRRDGMFGRVTLARRYVR
jgi:hypothetical protein